MDRSRRRHHRERVIHTRKKFYENSTGDPLWCVPGKLAKRKPMDCGVPGCWYCHSAPKGHPRKRVPLE